MIAHVAGISNSHSEWHLLHSTTPLTMVALGLSGTLIVPSVGLSVGILPTFTSHTAFPFPFSAHVKLIIFNGTCRERAALAYGSFSNRSIYGSHCPPPLTDRWSGNSGSFNNHWRTLASSSFSSFFYCLGRTCFFIVLASFITPSIRSFSEIGHSRSSSP